MTVEAGRPAIGVAGSPTDEKAPRNAPNRTDVPLTGEGPVPLPNTPQHAVLLKATVHLPAVLPF